MAPVCCNTGKYLHGPVTAPVSEYRGMSGWCSSVHIYYSGSVSKQSPPPLCILPQKWEEDPQRQALVFFSHHSCNRHRHRHRNRHRHRHRDRHRDTHAHTHTHTHTHERLCLEYHLFSLISISSTRPLSLSSPLLSIIYMIDVASTLARCGD